MPVLAIGICVKGKTKGHQVPKTGALWLLEKGREKSIIRGPVFLYDIFNHNSQVAKMVQTYLETMPLRKIKKMPVFIIFKGPLALLVGIYPLFSNHSLFKTVKKVEQIHKSNAVVHI